MYCNFIPDQLLIELGDTSSLKISKILRSDRNRIRRAFNKVVGTASLRSTYNCHNTTNKPGELILVDDRPPLGQNDKDIMNAHCCSDAVYRFYLDKFNRNSLDDKGSRINSHVHYDKDLNNAFFDGSAMFYGDGDGKYFLPFSGALDVVGHELTHWVVDSSAKLFYYAQPGASNESFADIFGVAIKHFMHEESNPKKANWLIGDSIVGPDFPGKAIRSFKDEKAYKGDRQPKYMKNYIWTFEDNAGVHWNSGILNHAFYLMCLEMNQPSYEKPIQIMYRALLKLNSLSGFSQVVKAVIKSAEELYGIGSLEAKDVRKAYKNVGL